jgi:hypothetical protein
MVVCPKCGERIRFINASKSMNPEKVFIVDPEPREIISNMGRVITGFFPHVCKGGKDGDKETSSQAASQKPQ